MALANASDLRDSIKSWVKDSTLTDAVLNDCIGLAENELNTKLSITFLEQYETLTATIGSRDLTPSAEFIDPISLHLTTYGDWQELPISPAGKQAHRDTGNAPPRSWAIVGTGTTRKIELSHKADRAHTFEFFRRLPALDLVSSSTNWLMTNHPNIYLFMSGAFAYLFKENFASHERWKGYAIDMARQLQIADQKIAGRARVSVDQALLRRSTFNIVSGDS